MSALVAVGELVAPVGRVVGLALLAGVVAAVAGLLYKSYARERMPEGLAVLVGLGTVGLWRNTETALEQFLWSGEVVVSAEVAFVNVAAFALGSVTAVVGARTGERLVTDAVALTGATELDGEVSRIVRTVGRFTTVELPEEIDDVDDYEPVAPETKAALAGKSLRFPRGLTVAELRDRLAARLRDDYGVGHVDVDLEDDGTVAYLAVGGRAAGIGPTLPPGTVAVAIRGDPAFNASAGDLVQVWTTGGKAGSDAEESEREDGDESKGDGSKGDGSDDALGAGGPERVATAELRAAVGDVATLAVAEDDAAALDPETEYRLATLPTEPRADREFSARLRAADETVGAVAVREGSSLVGTPVGDLDAAVVAIRTSEGVETLPASDRALAVGDTLYVIARPDQLRKVEAAAGASAQTGADERPNA